MKRLFLLSLAVISIIVISLGAFGLLMLAACQPPKSTIANPTAAVLTQTPDDLEPTDEAWNYRANVFINGASNPWPEVQTVSVTLKNDAGEIIINYRNVIESQSGQTRNNIVNIFIPASNIQINAPVLNVNNPPEGIIPVVDTGRQISAGWQEVIEFGIAPNIKPGQYNLEIDVKVNGTDYGLISCTIKVT